MPGRRYSLAVVSRVQARGLFLFVCLLSSAVAGAQTGDAPNAPRQNVPAGTATTVDVDALPISLERIGEQLEKPPVLDLSATRPTFRVQIYGTRPRWTTSIDWLGTAEGGTPPVGTPWHDQFLNMVTPSQARSFGAFTGTDLLQVMATSLAQGLGASAVAGKIKSSLRDRRERQAREEVDAAIAEWKKERDAAAAKAAQPLP
jgi:hypothetical protein